MRKELIVFALLAVARAHEEFVDETELTTGSNEVNVDENVVLDEAGFKENDDVAKK